eukprot:5368369-Amphidinium_carterae.1
MAHWRMQPSQGKTIHLSVRAFVQLDVASRHPKSSLVARRHTLQVFTRNFDLIAERQSAIYHLRELAKAT